MVNVLLIIFSSQRTYSSVFKYTICQFPTWFSIFFYLCYFSYGGQNGSPSTFARATERTKKS